MIKEKLFISLLSLSILLSMLTLGLIVWINDGIVLRPGATDELSCNVTGINLHGTLVTYPTPQNDSLPPLDETASEDVLAAITQSENDPAIKAILLEVDSSGGSPVAGEEISDALRAAKKPTVALIRGSGTSAAYLAATGAEKIFSSVFSDVGGIGVTMSYEDYAKQNEKEGITYNSLSTGRFKELGSPSKPLTSAERALVMRNLEIMHKDFIKKVAENRSLDIGKVTALADGSTMLGAAALSQGLIDELGGQGEVNDYLEAKVEEMPEYCWQ